MPVNATLKANGDLFLLACYDCHSFKFEVFVCFAVVTVCVSQLACSFPCVTIHLETQEQAVNQL